MRGLQRHTDQMLNDFWPHTHLNLPISRLELRFPSEGELPGLARIAANGVHDPCEQPFLRPWTDLPRPDTSHCDCRAHAKQESVWPRGVTCSSRRGSRIRRSGCVAPVTAGVRVAAQLSRTVPSHLVSNQLM